MKRFPVWKISAFILFGLLGAASIGLAAGDSWEKKKPTAEPIWASAAAVVKNKIYVTGGRTPDGLALRTLRVYDPAKDEWTTKAEMHVPRFRHCACAVNGKMYVFGGTQDNHGPSVLSSVEEYDPKNDTWIEKASMPTPRHSFTVSALDGKIYAIGGSKGALSSAWNWVAYKTVEVYDPILDIWEKRRDMNHSRTTHAAGVVNGRIYLIAGMSGSSDSFAWGNRIEEYNPEEDEWKDKAILQLNRGHVSSATVNNRIYVIGGINVALPAQDPNRYLKDVEVYKAPTDTCVKKTDMPTGRSDMSIGAANGRIYVIGGWAGFFLRNVEEYTPEDFHQDGELQQPVSPQEKLISTWASIKASSSGL